MTTRNPLSIVARAALVGACLMSSVSCGGALLRTGRSPVYLVITEIETFANGTTASAFLLSDVATVSGAVVNDNVTVTMRIEPKNPLALTSALNDVTMTRYRVVFRRSDGRNTPGVDVPYAFDGALNGTIPSGSNVAFAFELVRHQAKLEAPLRAMRGLGGLAIISTVAEITVWGRDQNGNELTATGSIDVHFGDFPDED